MIGIAVLAVFRLLLSRGDNVKWMNRIAGSLMIAVGMWLAVS